MAGSALVLLLAAYALVTATRYFAGTAAVERHHVESAVLIFVIAAGVRRALAWPTASPPANDAPPAGHPWLLSLGVVFFLYWPALFIGLLSDDHELVLRASTGDLSAASPILFRPLPLLVWSAIAGAGGGAFAFHLLNLVLHAASGALVVGLLRGPGTGRGWSLAGGLVFLAMPISVEAVVWCSGVFDVMATFAVLAAATAATHLLNGRPDWRWRTVLMASLVAAPLSKESAVVAPALVWIVCRVRGPIPASLTRDLGLAGALSVVYGAWRATAIVDVLPPEWTRYAVQRALFSTVGSFAIPMHADVLAWAPCAAVVAAVLLVALVARFAIGPATRTQVLIVAAGFVWMLVATAPVFHVLPVATDLQGARYLYLASVGWAMVVAGLLSSLAEGPAVARRLAAGTAIALILGGGIVVTAHLAPWERAGRLRDVVLRAAADPAVVACGDVRLDGLPETVGGAYVFRNGVEELFAPRLRVVEQPDDPSCVFWWDADRERFTRD